VTFGGHFDVVFFISKSSHQIFSIIIQSLFFFPRVLLRFANYFFYALFYSIVNN